MYRSRIPPTTRGERQKPAVGSVLKAHTSPSVRRRKLMASSSGLFQSMTMSKINHSEQLGSNAQPEGWVHVSRTSRWHIFSAPSFSVDGKVSPSTLSIGSALTLPSSLTSNSAAMLDLTSSLKAFMDGGEYLVHYQSLLALCVLLP